MNQEEKALRNNIRHLIRFVKNKKSSDKALFEQNIIKLAELELNSKLDAEWFKNIGFTQEEIAQALAGTMKEQEEAKQKTLECPKCGHAW